MWVVHTPHPAPTAHRAPTPGGWVAGGMRGVGLALGGYQIWERDCWVTKYSAAGSSSGGPSKLLSAQKPLPLAQKPL